MQCHFVHIFYFRFFLCAAKTTFIFNVRCVPIARPNSTEFKLTAYVPFIKFFNNFQFIFFALSHISSLLVRIEFIDHIRLLSPLTLAQITSSASSNGSNTDLIRFRENVCYVNERRIKKISINI